jgi:actin, other eukaryote
VKNWEQLETLWKVMMDDIGLTSSDSTSVLITEAPNASHLDRLKWAEMLFETYRVPSIYIANSASLSLFASGRTTGVVVECGAGITSSVPVFEGLALAHASTTIDYAGQDISYNILTSLEDQGVSIDAPYARMLKERMAFIKSTQPITQTKRPGSRATTVTSSTAAFDDPIAHFSLPDGTDVSVDRTLFSRCTDDLFVNTSFEPNGLISQVTETLQLCDDSLQKDLSNNIVIAGGTSMISGESSPLVCLASSHSIGFGDRLERDLSALVFKNSTSRKPPANIRVVPSSSFRSSFVFVFSPLSTLTHHREAGYTSQRKVAAWIGGSIVASLETFRQMKITRQEWEENPNSCASAKYV